MKALSQVLCYLQFNWKIYWTHWAFMSCLHDSRPVKACESDFSSALNTQCNNHILGLIQVPYKNIHNRKKKESQWENERIWFKFIKKVPALSAEGNITGFDINYEITHIWKRFRLRKNGKLTPAPKALIPPTWNASIKSALCFTRSVSQLSCIRKTNSAATPTLTTCEGLGRFGPPCSLFSARSINRASGGGPRF